MRKAFAVVSGSLLAVAMIAPGWAAESSNAASSSGVQVIDEVVVTADADQRDPRLPASDAAYLPETSETGSRLGGIPQDLTQTVDVVPEQLMIDRGVTNIVEALETVPGVRPAVSFEVGADSTTGIRSRGFESNYTLIDGARIQAFGFPWDISSVQKLEVLKGPAGVLYGQGDPGGALNLVIKRPLAEPHYAGRFTGGSFNFYRAETDLGGPVPGTNGALLYRLNAAFQTTDGYRDFTGGQRYYVAPAVTWFITPDTKLELFFSYLYERLRLDRGQPADPLIFDIPGSRTVNEANMPWSNAELFSTIAKLEHAFNEDWKIRQFVAFFYQTTHGYQIFASQRIDDTDLFARGAGRRYGENKHLTSQTELYGAFETGPLKHKTMLGFEYSYVNFGYGISTSTQQFAPFDWKNPHYGDVDSGGAYEFNYPPEQYGDNTFALYFDHQIEILRNLKLALGSRFDWSFGFYENRVSGENYPASDSFGWSPRVGLVYSPIPSVDLYGSWARTFKPNLFADGEGNTYEPELGENFEVGLRHRFLKNRVQATIAAFRITKDNVLNPDPDDPNGILQVLTGQERSQGFEVDVMGSILPGWDVTASYAYVDAKITESTTGEAGLSLVDAPRNQASLFTRYQFQNGPLTGLFAGAGMFYVDARRGSFGNPDFILPAYIRYDANVGYQAKHWRVQVNFENLTNVKYYNTQGNLIYPQAPFNVNASIAFNF